MRRSLLVLTAVAALSACENGGAALTFGITATGIVRGEVYFDANGSRTRDAADVGFAGARIRLLSPGGADTLFRATTAADGQRGFPLARGKCICQCKNSYNT